MVVERVREYGDPRIDAGCIAMQVIEHGSSSGWCGSSLEIAAVQDILKDYYNIVYTDNMYGTWELKTMKEDE